MAPPDHSAHCMVALYPPIDTAKALAVDGGLPPEKMHVTVAYCGLADDVDADALRRAAAALTERQPISASISGHARFTGDDQDVIVAIVDSPELDDLRRDALKALKAEGIEPPRNHGYVAHMTIAYLDRDEPSPVDRLETDAIEFTTLSAKHGADRADYGLEHPISAPAREAFAAGWAASGGPMTDRVRAASIAAIRTAIEHADDPRILEVTIDLGKLEGMWAQLFARREKLIHQYTDTVTTAWRPLITRRLFRDQLYNLRAELGLREADRSKTIRDAAKAAARAILQTLPLTAGWAALRQAIRNALAAGRAEGIVNAVAIAAEQAGRVGLDWDIAFDHAYQQLERLGGLWSDADDWLARTVDRAADDLGRMLADKAEAGASYDDMLDAAMNLLDNDDIDAVRFVVDWAMTTGADQGALSLYRSEGATTATWITAGDGRVCPTCENNEAGSPWPLADFPTMPSHPACRCVAAADLSLNRFASWFTAA